MTGAPLKRPDAKKAPAPHEELVLEPLSNEAAPAAVPPEAADAEPTFEIELEADDARGTEPGHVVPTAQGDAAVENAAGDADDEDTLAEPGTLDFDDGVDTRAAIDIVNHLLWHKALIDENDDGQRLDEYIDLVRASEKGEHLTIRNDFDKSIALAFELVLQEHLNPWKIDLGEFSRMYLARANEEKLDLVTAGRIILMAWTVLKLQSDAMVELAERLAAPVEDLEPDFLDWGDIGDWDYDDEGYEFTRRVNHSPQAPIDEKVRRRGASRKVTLMELVDAFEEVRREAEERKVTMAERERIRKMLRKEAGESVNEMMHADDPEEDQRRIWERVAGMNGSFFPLRDLHTEEIDDFTTTFTGVLFLAADRKVDLWQEDFPWGPILVKNRIAAGLLPEDPPTVPKGAVVLPEGGQEIVLSDDEPVESESE